MSQSVFLGIYMNELVLLLGLLILDPDWYWDAPAGVIRILGGFLGEMHDN